VLANEMLATNLGRALGLQMPRVEVIEVSDWLIEHTEDLRISLGGAKIPCRSGKQLGSLYVGPESPGMTFDYLPHELLQREVNIGDFARVLVLDHLAVRCRYSRRVVRRRSHGLNRLAETLHRRRGAIRNLITELRRSSRNPFPNWRESPADSAMPLAARNRLLEAQRP
jgi:hypothetical protein